uniref:DNA (cytosine-5-)-methyltransferase n=1 Tax=Saccharum hybrid cultivar R570 TaxID=131158 RepID=A0A059PYX8_9POAL|nr:methyltransferase [Saccharum hybrid cultivar R570]
MAPSSPSSAAPARVSARKRAAKAEEIHQNQEEEEVAAASSAKRRRKGGRLLPRRSPKQGKSPKAGRKKKGEAEAEEPVEDDVCADEPDEEELAIGRGGGRGPRRRSRPCRMKQLRPLQGRLGKKRVGRRTAAAVGDHEPEFVGEPVPAPEARSSWPKRYERSTAAQEEEEVKARCHYRSAKVDNVVYSLENKADYIGRITEFFEGIDQCHYFTCRWFFRAEDTMDSKAKAQLIEHCDLYYDMSYSVEYSTFANIPSGNCSISLGGNCFTFLQFETTSGISSDDADLEMSSGRPGRTATLLDLYSGCGGIFACQSLKYNHPQTEVWVRNEKADDFLALLKEWSVLCDKYVHQDMGSDLASSENEEDGSSLLDKDEFVVEKLIGICYGGSGRDNGLYFKVHWEGYGPEEDTWEPIDNLSDCPLKIKEFVQEGYRRKILPLPGDVDVICGGPPCQGISGFNRFRNHNEPLKDEKNKQMVTFMDIVAYLKPKYVLMENVVDILKFADGYLGRYALSCLVAMNYQARLGMMVAGCYGLPQFRMRVFLWGALSSMQCIVAYDETQKPSLKKALLLGDAISDLPEGKVENHQPNDVMEYGGSPKTGFQRYIRLGRKDMLDWSFGGEAGPNEGKLLDHQPLRLNSDDYERVQQIPVKKVFGANNVVEWDPEIKRVYLSSGKPLVPDYAMSFIKGKSSKPFGRLWWDEIVPTVVTRAEPHNQIILHPTQARVLTVRENARLQGFPDYYRLFGSIKEKYIQVGNAVAVPVARALGYCLGQAYLGESEGSHPLYELPPSFTRTVAQAGASSVATPAGEVVEQ